MKKVILFVSVAFLFVVSCTFDKYEVPKVTSSTTFHCDSVVHYSTINQIITNNCNGHNCHGTTSTASVVLVDNYPNLKNEVDNGKLMERVVVLKNMPDPTQSTPLDDSLISRIHCWITEGGPNP